MAKNIRQGWLITPRVFKGLTILLLAPILAVLYAAAQTSPVSSQGDPAAAENQNGRKVFEFQRCATCHGKDAQGLAQVGSPSVGPPRLPLTDFMKYVRNPTGSMPPYTKEALPDTDLKTIFAFLQSFPASPPEESRGGDAKSGEMTFTNYGCYECHGRQGQGSSKTSGPRLGPVTLSFSAFKSYVRHPAGSMPPYTAKVMSDAELANVYAFLKSRPTPQPASAIPLLNQ